MEFDNKDQIALRYLENKNRRLAVRYVGSRHATNLVFTGGHLGLMVSRAARASLWPHVGRWLAGQVAGDTPDASRAAAA